MRFSTFYKPDLHCKICRLQSMEIVPGLVMTNIAKWKITILSLGKSTISMAMFKSYVSQETRLQCFTNLTCEPRCIIPVTQSKLVHTEVFFMYFQPHSTMYGVCTPLQNGLSGNRAYISQKTYNRFSIIFPMKIGAPPMTSDKSKGGSFFDSYLEHHYGTAIRWNSQSEVETCQEFGYLIASNIWVSFVPNQNT